MPKERGAQNNRWSWRSENPGGATGISLGRPALILAAGVLVAALILTAGYVLLVRQPYLFGVIGNDGVHLQEEQEAGVRAKVVEFSWREFYPSEGEKDRAYIDSKKEELAELRGAGFEIILSLGYHDTPPWVHENYQDTYYVNQQGEEWTGDTFLSDGTPIDNGDANLVFNGELRSLVGSYLRDVFSEFGDDFYAVRLGGGRYGELTYPQADFGGESNLYWAYDTNAQRSAREAGISDWRPGDSSPDGEAGAFLEWYLDYLTKYQDWQISALRESYDGRIMMLYPSWGIRPGQVEEAVAANLDGSTPAERNGEIQRGLDFERQVGTIEDSNVLVTTAWLDADASGDSDEDPRYWSPVHYLSSLVEGHPQDPEMYGENTGRGEASEMELSASRMREYGLAGMAWYNEDQLFSDRYANLEDYERVIETSRKQDDR